MTSASFPLDTAELPPTAVEPAVVTKARPDLLIGVLLASTVPAAFWTALVWLSCPWFGVTVSGSALFGMALAISAFLCAVYATLLGTVD